MGSMQMRKITFSSFVKLFTLASGAMGVLVGIIAFLGSLIGLPVTTTLLVLRLTGVQAGVVAIFLAPLIFALFGLILSVFAYWPFNFLLKVFGGINLQGDFK